jgi:hypothetical protein
MTTHGSAPEASGDGLCGRLRARPLIGLALRHAVLVLGAAVSACSGGGAPGGGQSDAAVDSGAPLPGDAGAPLADSGPGPGSDASDASVTYVLRFVAGSSYLLYASIGGGAPHEVQLDTGSNGLYVPRSVVGSSAQISATDTCSVTYVSSGNTLSGHRATGPVALLGSAKAGDLPAPPTTVAMPFCAVDDATWTGGMMGVGFGRAVSDPTLNVLLQLAEVHTGTMHPGYVLSTRPAPNVEIGISAARAAGFQTIPLTPSASGNGDWVATSLTGCLDLPGASAFQQECGGLLVDTGVPEVILWGPTDPTLGGVVASGQTSVPTGTAVRITTPAGPMLSFSFVLGTGADSPSAVDLRSASAFSINTGRALIVDYDYLFDARAGLVGFQRL